MPDHVHAVHAAVFVDGEGNSRDRHTGKQLTPTGAELVTLVGSSGGTPLVPHPTILASRGGTFEPTCSFKVKCRTEWEASYRTGDGALCV